MRKLTDCELKCILGGAKSCAQNFSLIPGESCVVAAGNYTIEVIPDNSGSSTYYTVTWCDGVALLGGLGPDALWSVCAPGQELMLYNSAGSTDPMKGKTYITAV